MVLELGVARYRAIVSTTGWAGVATARGVIGRDGGADGGFLLLRGEENRFRIPLPVELVLVWLIEGVRVGAAR